MILSKPKSYKPKMAFHSQHINLLVRGELVQNTAISSLWTQFSTPIPLWLQERREVAELKQLTSSSQISPVPAENLSSEDVIQGFGIVAPQTITCDYRLIPRPKEEKEKVPGFSHLHMCLIISQYSMCWSVGECQCYLQSHIVNCMTLLFAVSNHLSNS